MTKQKIELQDCLACRGQCCRHVALQIEKPTCKREIDNIRWFLMHQDVHVLVDHEGDWLVEFKTRCKHLTKEYRCDNYAERPNVCRDYPENGSPCEYGDEDPPHKLLFTSAREFERWLERKGTDWRYNKHKKA